MENNIERALQSFQARFIPIRIIIIYVYGLKQRKSVTKRWGRVSFYTR